MTGNKSNSSLMYSTQAELKPNKVQLDSALLISTPNDNTNQQRKEKKLTCTVLFYHKEKVREKQKKTRKKK